MDKYLFAADENEIGKVISDTFAKYREYLRYTGLESLYSALHEQYYNGAYYSGRIKRTGEYGEISEISVNDFRNILQHIKVMATSAKPAFECRSINGDYKSQAQTILAPGLLEYYLYYGGLQKAETRTAEMSGLFGSSAIEAVWDYNLGDFHTVDEMGVPQNKGDIGYHTYGVFDMAYDVSAKTATDRPDWVILRKFKNKFILAEEYPEKAEEIRSASADFGRYERSYRQSYRFRDIDEDQIEYYCFYHARNAVLPQGKMVKVIGNGIVVDNKELPYKNIPVYFFAASKLEGTNIGYSVSFDGLPIQRAEDIAISSALTNVATFGIQHIAVVKGTDISPVNFEQPLSYIEVPSAQSMPQAVNFTKTPAEVYNFSEIMSKKQELIFGVNSTVRGAPPASLESGAALAMLSSQAIQFASDFQGEYVRSLEYMGLTTLELLRVHAGVERIVNISGKIPGQYIKSFVGKDLEGINRVIVDIGNPLARTTAGRMEMAKDMMQMGIIKQPTEYFQVVTTGRLDPMIQGEVAENLLIQAENEILLKGQIPYTLWTQNHPEHIKAHQVILSSIDIMERPEVVNAVLQHCFNSPESHMALWQTADPNVLSILGVPTLQPPMGATPPIPEGQAPAQIQPGQAPEEPVEGMPSMPNNPMTGKDFDFQTGGGQVPPPQAR